jgi:small conductance mechanosensitive channel
MLTDFFGELPFLTILLRLATAALVLLIGRRIARFSRNWANAALVKTELTPSLVLLFTRITYYGILLLAVILALTILGVPLTSTLAVIGIIVILVGIALRESLANFAATVIFLLFQPYKVGETVETAGVLGIVKEIQLFHTVIQTFDNKMVTAPNSKVQDSNIINYSRAGILRADVEVLVSYNADLRQVKQRLTDVLTADNRVLSEPPAVIAILSFEDNGMRMGVRPFVKVADYWAMQFDLRERIKEQFDTAGITIPVPQRDVHLEMRNEK